MRPASIFLLFLCLYSHKAWPQCLKVDSPADNELVLIQGDIVRIQGTTTKDGPVQIQVYPEPPQSYLADVIGAHWSVDADIRLETASIVVVRVPGCTTELSLLLTPIARTKVPPRAPATFGIQWQEAAEAGIRNLGVRTLDSLPNPESFLQDVKRGSLSVARQYLGEFAISLTEGAASNRITVLGEKETRGRYALTLPPLDCGDELQDASINVYIGSIERNIQKWPNLWTILRKDDIPARRAEDLAQLIGTVIAHEILHAVGLLNCPWMQGVDEHNDPNFLLGTGKRFGNGFNLMDPFDTVLPTTLIGREDTSSTPRSRLRIDAFSRSYLIQIHPRN